MSVVITVWWWCCVVLIRDECSDNSMMVVLSGVEAQTLTVWHQADQYTVPRVVFVNKMDKMGADFHSSVTSLSDKLGVLPLVVQLPVGRERTFSGIIDIITMATMTWDDTRSHGESYSSLPLSTSDALYEPAMRVRRSLVEHLANLDEEFGELFLTSENVEAISVESIKCALRRVTLASRGVPVLCGSALHNTGVQPLMDAVLSYLPSPSDRSYPFLQYYSNSLCGLVFKIIHDRQRGPLSFVRLYGGEVESGGWVYNVNRQCNERVSRLMLISADHLQDVHSSSAGNIVAIAGLKQSVTGDTIVSSASCAKQAQQMFTASHPDHQSDTPHTAAPLLAGLIVPRPVFLCSIEPPSLASQKVLDDALRCLLREDPSLHVHTDPDTAQTIISGMGELHLEIIRDRLQAEYGIDCHLGPFQIAYKEAIEGSAGVTEEINEVIGGVQNRVKMMMEVCPVERGAGQGEGLRVKPSSDSDMEVNKLWSKHIKAMEDGTKSALSRGPIMGFEVLDVEVTLRDFSASRATTLPVVLACAAQCVSSALVAAQPVLLEPVMNLEVTTSEDYLSLVMGDLSKRRAFVNDVRAKDSVRVIEAQAPLAELRGYSTSLRTITSGTASFWMELGAYLKMNDHQKDKVVSGLV